MFCTTLFWCSPKRPSVAWRARANLYRNLKNSPGPVAIQNEICLRIRRYVARDMFFLLTDLCEIEPVSCRISRSLLRRCAGFLFARRATKKLPMPFTFGFVVAQTIKQSLKTNGNRTALACTWIHSPENDREKCSLSVFSQRWPWPTS